VGDGELKEAVADSGPLIHLAEIGCLQLLCLFDILHVPRAVWLETVEQARLSERDLSAATNIQRYALPHSEVNQFVEENKITELHAGERECLFLCREKRIAILLTDDMAVRDAAKTLDLMPVGSLGVVAKAYKRGHISLNDAEHYIADLYNISSLFVTRSIADLAIEKLRATAKQ
jgi:predicted nucleic acid-binding protein